MLELFHYRRNGIRTFVLTKSKGEFVVVDV